MVELVPKRLTWPTVGKVRPGLVEFGPQLAESGRKWPKPAKLGPIRAEIDRCRPDSGKFLPMSERIPQNPGDSGRCGPNAGRTRSEDGLCVANSRRNSARVGKTCAQNWQAFGKVPEPGALTSATLEPPRPDLAQVRTMGKFERCHLCAAPSPPCQGRLRPKAGRTRQFRPMLARAEPNQANLGVGRMRAEFGQFWAGIAQVQPIWAHKFGRNRYLTRAASYECPKHSTH